MTRRRSLTPRQLRFCHLYASGMSAKEAYVRSGYSGVGRVAESGASELLKEPRVAARIGKLMREYAEKSEIKAEHVLREVARIAFTDIRSLFDEKGNLKPLDVIDEDAAAAIASIETETRTNVEGATITVRKVKAYNKLEALDRLMKHKGLFKADNEQQANPLKQLLELVQGRTTGLAGLGGRPILPVQVNDVNRAKALESDESEKM